MKGNLNIKGILKKSLLTAGMVCAIPLALTATASASTTTLHIGSNGPAVEQLQQNLKNLGYYSYTIDGDFGSITEAAVKRLQSAKHITADGIVGPNTRRFLGSLSSSRTVKISSSSYNAVKLSTAKPSSVISTAKSLQGVPYRWGGTTASGFDCSGYVNYVYKKNGINLPRTTSEMYSQSHSVSNPQPGDLVFFNTGGGVSHVGVYVGNNEFISATSSHGVKVASLDNSYWGPRYIGAKRPNAWTYYA
ncbi:NlpC/P60 family protein [Aneurinibacillus sp. Ricciae_BoGa-3]|uniref:C40 family peptidase n=1 Tax=Aneurinibacillus sp. Ricciae_BoGa-3 TaxID=3022697 RepID=UPI0023416A08|nr:NlpC/P60 family protein [Aneurinibacillus sp. Ricciae_BoGa-3]WCK56008.1 NlpC/P60 family protein [Aneurinibacillus sp. Ricciae_BoGa-3]